MWEPFSRTADKWITLIPIAISLCIFSIIILLVFLVSPLTGLWGAIFIFFLYYIPFVFVANTDTTAKVV